MRQLTQAMAELDNKKAEIQQQIEQVRQKGAVLIFEQLEQKVSEGDESAKRLLQELAKKSIKGARGDKHLKQYLDELATMQNHSNDSVQSF